MDQHALFMQQAIDLAEANILQGGGPFGAVITQNGTIIGTGANLVTLNNDPTAHAEIMAIRDACHNLNTFTLENCTIYSSCEPCPMCLAAIYWARLSKLYYGANRKDAGKAGFRDDFIYEEFAMPPPQRSLKTEQIQRQEALSSFKSWQDNLAKTLY